MAKRKKAAPAVTQAPEIELEVPAVIDPTPPETPDMPMTEPEVPANETMEPVVDSSSEQSQERPPEPPEAPHAAVQPAHLPLNDFIKHIEREAQDLYGMPVVAASHPDAEDGSYFQGTYGGIRMTKGDLGHVLPSGERFGAFADKE